MSSKVAEIISERFVEALSSGVVPWRRPWKSQRPYNLKSKSQYQGVNMLMLGLAGYTDPRWVTYKQATDLGGNIKKGEKGWPIVFFKMIPDKKHQPAEGERQRKIPLLRYTTAFNVEQTEGIELPELTYGKPIVSDEYVDDFIRACGIKAVTGPAPAYSVRTDTIILPPMESFTSKEGYYSTYFHELVHSTGHPGRLDRFSAETVNEMYGKEELIAEIGSSILRAELCVETPDEFEQSAAYLAGWISRLTDEPGLILWAASRAENGVNWLKDAVASNDQTPGMLDEFADEFVLEE
jgi:antirestriction protein ArdC